MPRVLASQAHLLPQSVETEEALLGALLIDPDAVHAARERNIAPRDFYRESHQWIYAAMMSLADSGKTPDFVLVSDTLANRKNGSKSQLDALGGPAKLTHLIEACTSSVYAGHYADLVKEYGIRRRLIAAASEVSDIAQNFDEGGVDGLYDQAARALFRAIEVPANGSHLSGMAAITAYERHQKERADLIKDNPDALMKTGLPSLDHILGPLMAAYLHVVVARTSVGKTMYMEQVAEENASKGHRVVYYHLELTHETMLHRCVLRRLPWNSRVTYHDLVSGEMNPDIEDSLIEISAWADNITFVHCPGWSVERLASDIMRLRARGLCDMAVVDYLQKIALPDRTSFNSAMLLGLMAERLKTVAEEAEIPIILGSQVSRAFKARSDKRPRMEDIRNSGEVEEKSTQVVVLSRKVERQEGEPGLTYGQSELLNASVEKNSNGPLGLATIAHRMGRYMLYCPARGG